jgi:hypothetical protein
MHIEVNSKRDQSFELLDPANDQHQYPLLYLRCSRVNLLRILLDVLVKPCDGLVECLDRMVSDYQLGSANAISYLLLRPLDLGLRDISPNSKAMLDVGIEVNLPWYIFFK